MSWPILLTPDQSCAVLEVVRAYHGVSTGDGKYLIGVLASQLERGLAIDFEEQDLLRHILKSVLIEHGTDQHLEIAFHKLFGFWAIPPYWEEGLRAKGWTP